MPLFVPRLEQNGTVEVVGNGREWPANVAGRADSRPRPAPCTNPRQVLPERDRALGQRRLARRCARRPRSAPAASGPAHSRPGLPTPPELTCGTGTSVCRRWSKSCRWRQNPGRRSRRVQRLMARQPRRPSEPWSGISGSPGPARPASRALRPATSSGACVARVVSLPSDREPLRRRPAASSVWETPGSESTEVFGWQPASRPRSPTAPHFPHHSIHERLPRPLPIAHARLHGLDTAFGAEL